VNDYGQLAITATAGILLFLPLVWAYRKGTQIFRKISLDIGLLVLVLVFFGVVVDMMHEAVHLGYVVYFIMGFVEESGEMLAVSLILWYIFLLNVRGTNADCYLCDFVRNVLTRHYTWQQFRWAPLPPASLIVNQSIPICIIQLPDLSGLVRQVSAFGTKQTFRIKLWPKAL